MEIFALSKIIVETGSTGMLIALLVAIAIPSLRKKIFGGLNGDAVDIKDKLNAIQENHLQHIDGKLDKISEKIDEKFGTLLDAEKEGNLVSKEILLVLKNKL